MLSLLSSGKKEAKELLLLRQARSGFVALAKGGNIPAKSR
jgi:hypothetical protein